MYFRDTEALFRQQFETKDWQLRNVSFTQFNSTEEPKPAKLTEMGHEYPFKMEGNLLCLRDQPCAYPPPLPGAQEEIVSLDISKEGIVAAASSSGKLYLSDTELKQWVYAGVGSSVSISSQNGWTVLVAGDSFCWNSQQNNCHLAYPVCEAEPKPMKHVLSYSYGPTKEFSNFIN